MIFSGLLLVGAEAGLRRDETQRCLAQNSGLGLLLRGRHLIDARLGYETGRQRLKRAIGENKHCPATKSRPERTQQDLVPSLP